MKRRLRQVAATLLVAAAVEILLVVWWWAVRGLDGDIGFAHTVTAALLVWVAIGLLMVTDLADEVVS